MNRIYAAVTGFALAALVFFCGLIAFQTLANQPSPLEFEQGRAIAFPEGDDTIIIYQRDIKANNKIRYDLERAVSCEYKGAHYVQDLPPLIREIAAHETKSEKRVLNFPVTLPPGTNCELTTTVLWAPTFSMINHSYVLPPIKFMVEEKSRHWRLYD